MVILVNPDFKHTGWYLYKGERICKVIQSTTLINPKTFDPDVHCIVVWLGDDKWKGFTDGSVPLSDLTPLPDELYPILSDSI